MDASERIILYIDVLPNVIFCGMLYTVKDGLDDTPKYIDDID